MPFTVSNIAYTVSTIGYSVLTSACNVNSPYAAMVCEAGPVPSLKVSFRRVITHIYDCTTSSSYVT